MLRFFVVTEKFLMKDDLELLEKIQEADFFVCDSQYRRFVGLKYDRYKMSEPEICFIGYLYSDIVLARQYALISGKRIFVDNDFSAALFYHSRIDELNFEDLEKLAVLYAKVL